MADWTTIGVGVLTATAALGGSLGGQALQLRAERARHRREVRRQDNDARRLAYLALFAETSKVLALADGAVATRTPAVPTSDVVHPFLNALAEAELRAPSQTWAEMKPFITVAQLRLNIAARTLTTSKQSEARAELEQFGGVDAEGLEQLRRQFLAAVQRDVGGGT